MRNCLAQNTDSHKSENTRNGNFDEYTYTGGTMITTSHAFVIVNNYDRCIQKNVSIT